MREEQNNNERPETKAEKKRVSEETREGKRRNKKSKLVLHVILDQ